MTNAEDKPPIEGSFEELTAHIAARLRRACAAMSDEEFAELVADIARMKLRFDEIDLRFGRSLPAHPARSVGLMTRPVTADSDGIDMSHHSRKRDEAPQALWKK